METLWKVLLFSVGVALILSVVRSGSKVAFMNFPSSEFISRTISRSIYRMFRLFLADDGDRTVRQKSLYWFSPLFLFGMIFSYFGIMLAGFALIYWSAGAEPSLLRACLASGSALSTLGFYTPPMLSGQIISIIEGGFGLGVVVFMLTFIPGYQSAVQSREDKMAWLYARTNRHPDCLSFFEWVNRSGLQSSMRGIWLEWEDYLRMIGDTHRDSPVLLFTPSVRAGESWVDGVSAILDAANFATSALDTEDEGAQHSCLQEGIYSVSRVAQSTPVKDFPAEWEQAVSPERSVFDDLCRSIGNLGFNVKADRDAAWLEFRENRQKYEPSLRILAHLSFMVLDGRLSQEDGGCKTQPAATNP